jgi:hypothetical protein
MVINKIKLLGSDIYNYVSHFFFGRSKYPPRKPLVPSWNLAVLWGFFKWPKLVNNFSDWFQIPRTDGSLMLKYPIPAGYCGCNLHVPDGYLFFSFVRVGGRSPEHHKRDLAKFYSQSERKFVIAIFWQNSRTYLCKYGKFWIFFPQKLATMGPFFKEMFPL